MKKGDKQGRKEPQSKPVKPGGSSRGISFLTIRWARGSSSLPTSISIHHILSFCVAARAGTMRIWEGLHQLWIRIRHPPQYPPPHHYHSLSHHQ
jgi:hypothetical protein